MTGLADLHPEELLVERELQGEALGARERRTLDEHVRTCHACRFIRGAAADFAREVPADAAPPPQLDRLIQTALWSVWAPAVPGGRAVRRAPVHGRAPRVVAAAVTICVGGFAAAHLAGLFNRRAAWPAGQPAAVAVSTPAAPAATAGAPEPRPLAVEEPAPAASAPAEPDPMPRGRAPKKSESGAGRPWEDLFRRATAARARGHVQQALRLYSELARDYPRSPEGTAGFAFKARLELDQGDARSAARDFDRYLARGSGGSLEEEALVGRAEALRSLGQRAEEAAAWKLLVNRFPGSAHARRARARLAELASAP